MNTLCLLRHAESVANLEGRLGGRSESPLSEAGRKDAQVLSQRFADQFKPDAIWCSPQRRTRETAKPFEEAFGSRVQVDDRLVEQDMGKFTGMTYQEAEADPTYQTNRLARWDWKPGGGGESYAQVALRVDAFLSTLEREWRESAWKTVLIISHAVTLRLTRATLDGTLPRYPESLIAHGELWVCRWTDDLRRPTIESKILAASDRHHRR